MQSDLLYFSVVDIGDFFRSFVDIYKRKKVMRKIKKENRHQVALGLKSLT